MSKVIFIVGATATGKSEVAFFLAKRMNAEIISCDSMLVYKEPKIITAKPPDKILSEIKHHFINIISVTQSYSVYDYYREATKKIKKLFSQDKTLLVCGGTGLYFKALLDGIFSQPNKDGGLRKKLYQEAEGSGLEKLYQRLKKVDPETAKKISKNDKKRIIRALEVYQLTGKPISAKKKEARGLWQKLPIEIFGLKLSRDQLYRRINQRVDKMFERGAIDEVRQLLTKNLGITAEKIIGVGEIKKYLETQGGDSPCSSYAKASEDRPGVIPLLEDAKEKMKQNTRNFAKRQITWFKKDPRIEWIDAESRTAKNVSDQIYDNLER